jgi:hypothetical protein
MSGLGKNNRPQTPEKTAENWADICPFERWIVYFLLHKTWSGKKGEIRGVMDLVGGGGGGEFFARKMGGFIAKVKIV